MSALFRRVLVAVHRLVVASWNLNACIVFLQVMRSVMPVLEAKQEAAELMPVVLLDDGAPGAY